MYTSPYESWQNRCRPALVYIHVHVVRALHTISTASPSQHTTSTYWLLILPSAEDGTHHLHQFICLVDCELERLATLHKTHCNTLLVFTVHLQYIYMYPWPRGVYVRYTVHPRLSNTRFSEPSII